MTLTFAGKAASFHGDARPPIKWLVQLKCADGAVLRQVGASTVVHLVELKSKLTPSELLKCGEQFFGGYTNALAICGVLEVAKPQAVTCVIGYKKDAVSPSVAANSSLAKVVPGNPLSVLIGNWALGKIDVPNVGECPLVTVQLDEVANTATLAI